MAEAVKDADLVIEAVPELKEIKENFYTQLGKVAPEKQYLQQTHLQCCQVILQNLQAVLKNS